MNGEPQVQRAELQFDWGSFTVGMIGGAVILLLLGTATGRGICSAAGRRTARRIEYGKCRS